MPWKPNDAKSKTQHADTAKKQRLWASVANNALKAGKSDAQAIRIANAAVRR